MKEFTSKDIRNFAVVGHGAAGKTVLCEATLVVTKDRVEEVKKVVKYLQDDKKENLL